MVQAWLGRRTGKWGVSDVSELSAAMGTTMGQVRSENQDRAVILRFTEPAIHGRAFLACVVCDGMGGMVDGGRCADIAMANFVRSLSESQLTAPSDSLRVAVLEANHSVFGAYRGRGGTTLTALLLTQHAGAWAVTVGDTRLYEYSPSARAAQISTDDTIAGELKRLRGADQLSELEGFSTRLAQYVGIGEAIEPRIQRVVPRTPDASYLISTDGIRPIGEVTLERISSAAPSYYALAHRLLHISNWSGGEDNASVICIGSRATAAARSPLRMGQPTLEIWDSFAKLDAIVPPPALPERLRNIATTPHRPDEPRPQAPPEGGGSRAAGRDTSTRTPGQGRGDHRKDRRRRRGPVSGPRAAKQLEIEVMEDAPPADPVPGDPAQENRTQKSGPGTPDAQQQPPGDGSSDK